MVVLWSPQVSNGVQYTHPIAVQPYAEVTVPQPIDATQQFQLQAQAHQLQTTEVLIQNGDTGPKRLHVTNIPFRFRDHDLAQMFGVIFSFGNSSSIFYFYFCQVWFWIVIIRAKKKGNSESFQVENHFEMQHLHTLHTFYLVVVLVGGAILNEIFFISGYSFIMLLTVLAWFFFLFPAIWKFSRLWDNLQWTRV